MEMRERKKEGKKGKEEGDGNVREEGRKGKRREGKGGRRKVGKGK